jgi:multidrug efflux system outer membrane protein
LQAQYGVRASQVDAAIAQYNETVVGAAREVASNVLRIQQVATQRQQRQLQLTATQQLLGSVQARAQQGLSDLRPVLMAQQSVAQQRAALTQLDSAALSAEIELLAALGGGYQDAVAATP